MSTVNPSQYLRNINSTKNSKEAFSSLGLEEEVVDGVEIDVARGGGCGQETRPLPEIKHFVNVKKD